MLLEVTRCAVSFGISDTASGTAEVTERKGRASGVELTDDDGTRRKRPADARTTELVLLSIGASGALETATCT
jgi:hypothetical protein